MRRIATAFALVAPILLLAACEQTKSASPLSPTVAGPIAGVVISEPVGVSPGDAAKISSDAQPVTLTVENATSNGVRPLTYMFEIATDSNFNNKIFSQTGIAQGEGRTSLRLPQSLASERAYFWRAKAYDGANEGDFTPPKSFSIFTPVVIGVPGLSNPADGGVTTTTKPILEVINAPVTGPAGTIHYLFEVATDSAMSNRILTADVVAGGAGRTAYGFAGDLSLNTRYFWRARAFDGSRVGDWTRVFSFLTPASTGNGSTGGGGGSTDPISSPDDQLDVKLITIARGADIRGWAVTSNLTSVTHIGTTLCTYHTKAGRWPEIGFFDTGATVEGNQWFFVNIGGRWYGGANEWLRPGQVCKDVAGPIGPDNFSGTPLGNWVPQPGELLGIAVSTPARSGQQGTAERSQIVMMRW